MEIITQDSVAGVLARLEEPFASKDVKWLVAATSRDNRKGRVTPYADPRAYTDRLNEVVTPSGWTREYTVHTVSPITRMKKDKAVQSGKVLVTCVVTIPGVGTHCGSGEEWADDENAMTSAEAQAFKRACSCFGLGRYFYSFGEMWVEVNDYRQPKQLPNLPAWALPANERGKNGNDAPGKHQERASGSASRGEVQIPKGPLDATVTDEIAGCRRDLGATLFMDVLERVAHVRSPRDIPNQKMQQTVLSSMRTCVGGMQRIREIAASLAETEFYAILDRLNIQSLDRIPSFEVFQELGRAMTAAAEGTAA
jgi:hypothetical protein